MEREDIVQEIRRIAAENDGVAPGARKFEVETGFRWRDGVYWARWNDAVREAGLEPNERRKPHPEDHLLEQIAQLVDELGRFPALSDLKLRRREDPTFPSPDSIQRRFRPWRTMIERVSEYSGTHPGLERVHEICVERLAAEPEPGAHESADGDEGVVNGFVYLMKSGKHYKIGRSNSVGRREYELAIQLPEPISLVHAIRTDDAAGIERYWHTRFADRHLNGEWFALSASDVSVFKRRKFM